MIRNFRKLQMLFENFIQVTVDLLEFDEFADLINSPIRLFLTSKYGLILRDQN